MLVRELIEELKRRNPKSEVYFAHPSHDHWRSELASPVDELDEERVKFSEYHGQMQTVKKSDDEHDDDDDKPEERTLLVVVLR